MWRVKLLIVILAFLCLMPEQSHESLYIQHHLPENARTVYTTDKTNCYLFRSYYGMRTFNYKRRRAGQPNLFLTTKTVCKTQCPKNCSNEIVRVCGEYAGIHTTFINDCERWKTACEYGISIIQVPYIECHLHEDIFLKERFPTEFLLYVP